MKQPYLILASLAFAASAPAAQLLYEPFDYTAAAPLTDLQGGSGWDSAWTQDGEPCVIAAAGMSYTDTTGKVLTVSGLAAETTGTATTRNFRATPSGTTLNDVWISFLYRVPVTNSKFEGLSFFRNSTTTPVFSVSNPSVDTTPSIYLTIGTAAGVNTHKGVFGTTHLIVLHLEDAATDKVSLYIDPLLTGNPSTPDATGQGSNLSFNSIRLAGQDGSTFTVDELRIGESFADVTPSAASADPDSDGDGLSDAQEAVLGLDPQASNAALVTAIKNHPDYFDLYTAAGMLAQANGGVILQKSGNNPLSFTFEVQHSSDLHAWPALETVTREVTLPSDKQFLRVTLESKIP